ncbi:MAG: cysteine desulfurase [Planctomycetota bacterium]|nr:MAG: cysteine desulfurase [Planctomycetota bacterium]
MTALRGQFPGLDDSQKGRPYVYLDSAATAQKHISVIERMDHFLRHEYGTVHRGLYRRSAIATQLYEEARNTVAAFFNAQGQNIVFTMGATDAINLVAWSWGRSHLRPGDRILVSAMEHHANIVPWQLISEITGAELIACPMDGQGNLDMESFNRLLDERVKMVSCIHIANSLGTINPVAEITRAAHAVGARVLIDAAQSAPHMPIDVIALDCDFLVCSAHKLYGPTGIGCLYGKSDVLESMPPWRGGGEMIEKVTFEKTTYASPPGRFEAGTPPIVEAIGFATACDFLNSIGMERIAKREAELYAQAEAMLSDIPSITRIGTAKARSTVLSFTMHGAHPADISQILDAQNIAIRAGHHCAQPTMAHFGIPATARISLGVYTSEEDLQLSTEALRKADNLFN